MKINLTGMLILPVLMAASAFGGEKVIWKIGEADHSDHEFSASYNPQASPPVVRMGSGNELKQWPKFHPGSGNGAFGGREHKFTLAFDVLDPRGVFYLDLSLLFRQPRVPAVDVEINGHRGRYYFDPQCMFELGNGDDQFNATRSVAQRKLALPGSIFKAGENLLSIIAVDDPPVVIDSQNVGGRGDSGFYYDALSLSQDADAAAEEKVDIVFTPTVFYPRSDKGVQEECWLTVRYPSGWAGGKANVSLGNFSTRIDLGKPGEFGEARHSILVPADAAAGVAKIELVGQKGAQTVTADFKPAKKWKLFYAPSEHLDIGFTDYRPKVAEVLSRSTDDLLKVLDVHPEYRFNLDGSWIIEQWLNTRSSAQAAKLAEHAKAGRIGMNAFYTSMVTAYPTMETLFRSLYYSKEIQGRCGIPFDFALTTDIPSNCWSVPSVLAASGVRYFADGGNQHRGPMIVYGHWSVRSPFWWEGPDGQRVLAWFSSHYHQLKALFGLPPAIESGRGGVARFLGTYERAGYAPDAVLIYGTEVENLPLDYADAEFVQRWNAKFAYPQIINCRFSEFFKYIEDHYGERLPVVRGDGGAYWADEENSVVGATARDRGNQARVISAETLATLTSALNPVLRFPKELDREIWRNILVFDEHTYGPSRGGGQPEHDETIGQLRDKFDYTIRAENDVDKLMRRSMSQLADLVPTEGKNLIVFNSLSWKRGGLVQFMVDRGTTLTDLATNQPVEYEVVAEKDGAQTIRFLAADVPALGYKVYAISKGQARRAAAAAAAVGNVVENRFYRITLDPARAAIKRVYDKELGRELVDPSSPYLLNEYLFAAVTSKGSTRYVDTFPWLPQAEIAIHHPEQGTLAGVEKTPWGQRIRMTASTLHTPRIETEILLRDDAKRIELRNFIQVDLLREKEACYFAFPWAMPNSAFRFETPNGFVNPEKDLLDGACNEWFVVQNWVNAADEKASVDVAIVDAPLVCLGDIYRGRWPRQFGKASSTIFSYALTNCWSPKWAGEKLGEYVYRYAISSRPAAAGGTFDALSSARLGREMRCPLEIAEIKASDKLLGKRGPLPPAQASFATLTPENVAVTALKAAEDGQGLVVRLMETAGRECDGVLALPFLKIASVNEANAVEAAGKTLPSDASGVHFHIKAHQAMTVRVTMR